jgi:hypothetical protein
MSKQNGERNGKRGNGSSVPGNGNGNGTASHPGNGNDITGILDERIQNLREAIQEIDDAMAGRKELNRAFLAQIDAEYEEVRRQLGMLQDPWKMGFHPQIEFLRLSFHKSLTSRAHERRSEELKHWENTVNLAKERRKFLDEYKSLLATRRRLRGE